MLLQKKYYQLEKVMGLYGLEVLGVTETHMPGSGSMVLDDGCLLVYSGTDDGHKRSGVGLCLSKKVKNSLISFTPVSERILTARLHSKHINISVTVVYAPTMSAIDSVKEDFYKELAVTQANLPAHDIKLVLGDFNARVGRDTETWPGVIGAHSYHQSDNDNGVRMLDFCTINDLTIGGTLFQHKNIHKGTWLSPDEKTTTQIDHICISRKWSHSLLDTKVCRGAQIGTTHKLVRGYLRVTLKAAFKSGGNRKKEPAIEKLRDRSAADDYCDALHIEYSNADNENKTLDEAWKHFRTKVDEVSLSVLGEKSRKKRVQHLSDATKDLLSKRDDVKKHRVTGATSRAQYSKLNKMVKKSCGADDDRWAARIATELEHAASRGQQREVWQKIKTLAKTNNKKKSAAIRDKDGNLLSDPDLQRKRWAEYFSELLNPERPAIDLSDLDDEEDLECFPFLADEDDPPSVHEISEGLKKLKNYKSPGEDGICNEQLKYGSGGLTMWLKEIFDKVWCEEKLPEDWLKGLIITVPKKGDLTQCGNSRGITLCSTASKLYQLIILNRMASGLESLYRDNQCGFRRNRSCIDQLHTLRIIMFQHVDNNLPLYVNFIDFKAAFDSIDRQFIWKAFRHYGLPEKYVRIFMAFFDHTMSAVRVGGEISDWFEVFSGSGQGNIQGPPLFNVCLNWIMELAMKFKVVSEGALLQKRVGSRRPAVNLTDVDYADDPAALDNTHAGLQETTDLISKYATYGGLSINVKKTNTMSISKSASQRPYMEDDLLETTVYGEYIEQVSQFTYLGSIICSDGTLNKELSVRIGKASGAFNQLNNIWKNKGIRLHTKMRIYKSAVLTIVTYGCEVWNTTQTQNRRIESFHHSCLRRILKVRWFHRVRNEDVLTRAHIKPIINFIAAKRMRWYGHVVRMPEGRMPGYLLEWTPKHGRRRRGGTRTSWIDAVMTDVNTFSGYVGVEHDEAKQLARDRKLWLQMVRRCTENDAGDSGGSQM